MKKTIVTTFCILMLCSLLLLINAGSIKAGNPEYSLLEYGAQGTTTVDGMWTEPDEWYDGPVLPLGDSGVYVYCMDFNTMGIQWCVEIFNDDTDDAEDYWQICLDADNSGGTAPQSGDFKIDIVGHTDLVCYEGNGAGWDVITPDAGEITWDNSISTSSSWNSTSHWILEIVILKETGAIVTGQPPNGMRVAVYDASNSAAGVQAWPPGSSADVPDEYGVISGFSMDPIPEGLTFGVMVLLSSVSLLVGYHYFRKRKETKVAAQ